MGGTESKIEDEQVVVSIYRHREEFMKEALSIRKSLAVAHSAYAVSLKTTGAFLSDFAHREFSYNPSSAVAPEEKVVLPVPMPPAVQTKGLIKKGDRKQLTLIQLFADLNHHFLESFDSTHDVSNMLAAVKLQFNSKPNDYFERVMHIVSGDRLSSTVGDFDAEENEAHATLLDEMLVWEKKLYDEVKAGEIMKYEYQKKVALLNTQKERGSNNKSLEKLEASASQLHTRYIVDMQSVDSIVAEINHIRDGRLYPNLVELVDGMATMWETMRYHHEAQLKIAYALKFLEIEPLDNLKSVREISGCSYDHTSLLYAVVHGWHMDFCKLIDYQKHYVNALCNWLKLNLVPIESSFLKEKVPSSPRVLNLPIQEFLLAWNDDLDKLPDELTITAMSNITAVIQTIMYQKEEEVKMREKCEAARKEFDLKSRQYQLWCMKNGVNEELVSDNPLKTAKEEREAVLISLEEDQKALLKSCNQAREKSFGNFKRCLTELFKEMSEFALASSVMYCNLRSIAQNS